MLKLYRNIFYKDVYISRCKTEMQICIPRVRVDSRYLQSLYNRCIFVQLTGWHLLPWQQECGQHSSQWSTTPLLSALHSWDTRSVWRSLWDMGRPWLEAAMSQWSTRNFVAATRRCWGTHEHVHKKYWEQRQCSCSLWHCRGAIEAGVAMVAAWTRIGCMPIKHKHFYFILLSSIVKW